MSNAGDEKDEADETQAAAEREGRKQAAEGQELDHGPLGGATEDEATKNSRERGHTAERAAQAAEKTAEDAAASNEPSE